MQRGGAGLSRWAWLLSVLFMCGVLFAVSSEPERAVDVGPPDAAANHEAAPRLGVDGTSLTLGGHVWWPIGINAYQLGTNWTINAGCGAQVDLDDYFGRLPPNSLTRVNIYSSFAVNKITGQLDFSALDAIFRAAARHRQLLIAVLTGGEGGCENEYFKGYDWYRGGWRTDVSHGLPMTYAAWLDVALTRWGRSPALAGWTPVGEPEPSTCGDATCRWQERNCPSDAADVLRTFYDEVGAEIRKLDPDSLIFSGHTGGGQCGSVGDDFTKVSASPGIDVVEYHFYQQWDSFPGDPRDGLRRRLEQAHALDKPLVVAEVGMKAGTCNSLDQRKRDVTNLVGVAREHGAAGAMFWSFVPDPRPDDCTFDIGPDDPLLKMVGAAQA